MKDPCCASCRGSKIERVQVRGLINNGRWYLKCSACRKFLQWEEELQQKQYQPPQNNNRATLQTQTQQQQQQQQTSEENSGFNETSSGRKTSPFSGSPPRSTLHTCPSLGLWVDDIRVEIQQAHPSPEHPRGGSSLGGSSQGNIGLGQQPTVVEQNNGIGKPSSIQKSPEAIPNAVNVDHVPSHSPGPYLGNLSNDPSWPSNQRASNITTVPPKGFKESHTESGSTRPCTGTLDNEELTSAHSSVGSIISAEELGALKKQIQDLSLKNKQLEGKLQERDNEVALLRREVDQLNRREVIRLEQEKQQQRAHHYTSVNREPYVYEPGAKRACPSTGPSSKTSLSEILLTAEFPDPSIEPPILDQELSVQELKRFLRQSGEDDNSTAGMDKAETIEFAKKKRGAWEVRRLLACAALPSSSKVSGSMWQGAQLAAALRKPKTPAVAALRFRELVLSVHPDKNPGDEVLATQAFQFLQAAFKELRSSATTTTTGGR